MQIECDGSISPKDALQEVSEDFDPTLYALSATSAFRLSLEERVEVEEFDETSLHMRQLLKTKLSDMDLSVRALNCLKAADIETLGELVSYNKNDLLKFRNFGKKSLTELEDLVEGQEPLVRNGREQVQTRQRVKSCGTTRILTTSVARPHTARPCFRTWRAHLIEHKRINTTVAKAKGFAAVLRALGDSFKG